MARIVKRTNKNNETRMHGYRNDGMQATIQRILEGTATLKDLTNVEEKVIDFKNCKRKIKMIQTIYNAGSKVGACTIVAGNMYTLKLTERTCEAFKKALLMLKERDSHEKYTTVWVEGVNKFTFRFNDGMFYVYYVVTNLEIEALEKRITAMDYNSVILEELQLLQNDLPPFVRAWQESSIDRSKDKSKVFIKDYDDFFSKVETKSTFFKSNLDKIVSNFSVLKQLHKAGRTNDMHYVITMPTFDPEKVFDDILGDVNYCIKDSVEAYFNGDLLDLYKMSSRTYYEQFADACLPYPELALFIQQIFKLTAQAHNEDVKILPEQYADLRNKIYTKAAVYGVEGAEVVKVAISVAMRYIKEKTIINKDGKEEIIIDLGTANVANYKDSKVTRIFPMEYVELRTGKPSYEELHIIWMQNGREIPEGEEIEFAAGFSADDTIELKEMFTGKAVNIGKKLMGIVDVYSYKESKSFITIETFTSEATPKNQIKDEGQHAAEFLESNNQVILTGGRSNVIISSDRKTLVCKVVPSKELIPSNSKAVICTVTNVLAFVPKAGQVRVFLMEIE